MNIQTLVLSGLYRHCVGTDGISSRGIYEVVGYVETIVKPQAIWFGTIQASDDLCRLWTFHVYEYEFPHVL